MTMFTKKEVSELVSAMKAEGIASATEKEKFAVSVAQLKKYPWEDGDEAEYDDNRSQFKSAFLAAGRQESAFNMWWTRLLKAAELKSPKARSKADEADEAAKAAKAGKAAKADVTVAPKGFKLVKEDVETFSTLEGAVELVFDALDIPESLVGLLIEHAAELKNWLEAFEAKPAKKLPRRKAA